MVSFILVLSHNLGNYFKRSFFLVIGGSRHTYICLFFHYTCLILFTYSLTHHIHNISFPVYHHKMLSLKKQIPVSFTMKPFRKPAAPAHHCCQMKMPSEERGSNLASSTGGLLVEVFLSVRQLQVVISSLHDIWVHSTGEPNRNQ